MDTIKQESEPVRDEREVTGVIAPPSPLADPVSGWAGVTQAHPAVGDAKSRVNYTRTTTIRVDAERLREHRIILSDGRDPVADSYKVLRTHVLQRMRANGWKTLAVTSPGEGNGKTVTAINLAISLAREVNQTILLVDLDLRRPSLGHYFVDGPARGISDYLTEGVDLADLLIHPGIERLVILPGNHSFTQSSEMLSSPRMVQLVDDLRSRYADRLIIFDMAPLLTGDDVIAFLPYVDAVMLVIEEGKTTKDELTDAYRLFGGKHVIGTVLNKSHDASSGIGHY